MSKKEKDERKEKEEVEQIKLEVLEQKVIDKILTLVMSALGFVAALAWNDAIQTTFQVIFGEQNKIWAKFIYAIILTTIVVLVSIQLERTLKRIKNGK
jgi:hypothetical protein